MNKPAFLHVVNFVGWLLSRTAWNKWGCLDSWRDMNEQASVIRETQSFFFNDILLAGTKLHQPLIYDLLCQSLCWLYIMHWDFPDPATSHINRTETKPRLGDSKHRDLWTEKCDPRVQYCIKAWKWHQWHQTWFYICWVIWDPVFIPSLKWMSESRWFHVDIMIGLYHLPS